jgi:MFS family permease
MGQVDASVVTLTYRPVETEFRAGLAGVEWVSLVYLLTLIALLIPVGRLSDAHGRKLFYLFGFAFFTAASAACGLAPTLLVLVVFRAVQAVGAALLQANSVALVTTTAPTGQRRNALGAQAAAQALGLALGPSLGGILVSTVGWRWVYFINVPVGLIALVAAHYLLPRTRERSPLTRLDASSIATLATASTLLFLGLSAASGLDLPVQITVACFVSAALVAWAFVRRQQRVAEPLVDPALFGNPVFAGGLLAAMCGYLVLFGPLVLVPVALAERGVTPLTAGLVLSALPAGFAIAAVGAPAILPAALADRQRATVGAVICSGALIATLAVSFSPGSLVLVLAIIGVGLGVFTPSNNATIMGAVPAALSATAGGLLNLTRSLGTALGVALVAFAFHAGSAHNGILQGDRLAVVFLVVAALTATAATRAGARS